MGSIPVRSTKNSRVIKYVGCFFLCLFVAEIEPRFDRLRGGRAPFVVQYFVFPTFPPLSGEFTRQEYQKQSSNKICRLFFLCLFVAEIEPRFDRLRGGRAPFVVNTSYFRHFPRYRGNLPVRSTRKTTIFCGFFIFSLYIVVDFL